MNKINKKIAVLSLVSAGFVLSGCSLAFAPYPSGIFKSQASIKGDVNGNNAYRNYKVFTGIEISGRTMEGVLDTLSLYQNENYVYESPYHIVFPEGIDVKVTNLKELKTAVETYTPFTLKFEKKPYNTYVVIAKVKDSRALKVKRTKGTLGDILKEIADTYNANLIINKNALKKGELGEYDTYVLNNNTVFDLKEAVSAYHDVFIDYNPYNKSVKVYKYKFIKKVLPGFEKKTIEHYLNGILSYDSSLQKPNSYYIDKDGLVIVKADFANYFEALRILNELKFLNDRNVNLELDYFKTKSITKIPYPILSKEIKSCGNYECVKEAIENYGSVTDWQKNYSTSKLNKKGRVISKEKNSETEFDYKVSAQDLKGKKFIIDYSMFKHKNKTELIKGSQSLPLNTYVPVYMKTESVKDGYTGVYYIIKLSSPLF